MNFEQLWQHQQGAVFLRQDEIYSHRKSLAEFFFRNGQKFEQDRADMLVKQYKKHCSCGYFENKVPCYVCEVIKKYKEMYGK